MDTALNLYSFTDLCPYSLPTEVLPGSLRTESDFQILEPLGCGRRKVTRCLDKGDPQKEVVIKYIMQADTKNRLAKETFREITILKSLDHVNVIKLIEVITVPEELNSLCLVTEYCPYSVSRYIKDMYKGDAIPRNHIKCIAKQMFQGLRYLHKNYVIHRDIKPDNLMLTKDGVLKIIDFDASKRLIHRNKTLTPDVGTRNYQAPEILFQATSYDTKVDMWSAGCVLAELFTRKTLMPGKSEIDQIKYMVDLIGAPNIKDWPGLNDCHIPKSISFKNQPYNMIKERFHDYNCSDAFEILIGLLKYNPETRYSADECLELDWLERAPFPTNPSDLELPAEVKNRNVVKTIAHKPQVEVVNLV